MISRIHSLPRHIDRNLLVPLHATSVNRYHFPGTALLLGARRLQLSLELV